NAGAYSKLQPLMPGETAVPGSATGKSGSPTAQTAGTPFTFTVKAVDTNWNVVTSDVSTVQLTSSDANAVLPANANLVAGTQTFSVTFKTAAAAGKTVTVAKTANPASTWTSAAAVVNTAGFSKLQLLMPGETASAGSATGKTGTPN